jgi:hypothetical protein
VKKIGTDKEGSPVMPRIYRRIRRTEVSGKTVSDLVGMLQNSDFHHQWDIMTTTVSAEREQAERNGELGFCVVFQGRNLIRFIIAVWPQIAQQFVRLTVFNTYTTYSLSNGA